MVPPTFSTITLRNKYVRSWLTYVFYYLYYIYFVQSQNTFNSQFMRKTGKMQIVPLLFLITVLCKSQLEVGLVKLLNEKLRKMKTAFLISLASVL